jgi:cell division protease FtsH
MVGLPDIKGREEILHVHMRKIPTDNDVKADILARGTPGFSGADLANLVNEAALFAARGNKAIVDMEDFEQAKDKIYMGPERKSLVMREEERMNTAYHESGHAVVAKLLPNADPVHKVTIMPRGYALGLTWQLPEFDRFSNFKTKMLEEISILFGGRIAEEVFMKQMSTGAGNDFERATKLARDMVTKYGMSDKLGTMVYADENQESFFGAPKAISQATQQLVDAEIKSILDKQYLIARKLIEKNKKKVEAMTKALLEYETIDSDQIDDVMAGKKVRAPKPSKSSNDKKMPPSGKAPTSSIKPQPATKSR